jgi:arginyl-tRNA synthetase
MISDTLQFHITKALDALDIAPPEEIGIEHPDDLAHGDYASNIAMVLASEVNTAPRELAEDIADELRSIRQGHRLSGSALSSPQGSAERPQDDFASLISKVEIAGPGFINFRVSDEWLIDAIADINRVGQDFGNNDELSGERVIVEYTDPNPFKVFHIGHLMSNTVGESLARLYEAAGAQVKRANYQGDVGMHVAKALWGIQKNDDLHPDSVADWGQAYAHGAQAYEKNEAVHKQIEEINKHIYEKGNTEIHALYQRGREVSLRSFEKLYDTLGTEFDYYFFESETGEDGKEIVEENTPKVFEESDSAIVFDGEKRSDALHTRVFVNQAGLPTYEAKELGLAWQKRYAVPERPAPWKDSTNRFEYDFDTSLIVTGNEVNEYFQVIFEALSAVYPDLADKQTHIGHGMLERKDGTISSRAGDVVAAEDVMHDIKSAAADRLERIANDLQEEAAEAVAVAALKYSILRNGIGKNITFDKEQALSFEGDSGPYLLYTYVRTQSVLRKADEKGISANCQNRPQDIGDLERRLYRFEEIVRTARQEHAPQLVTTYLTRIASDFNTLYADQPIIDADANEYYLALTEAVGYVLKNGLHLLGIDTIERM